MLVQTDFMTPSGEGNPIFSKIGALNRFQHLAFVERHFESQRVKDLQEIPEEFQQGEQNEFLPKILWNDKEKEANLSYFNLLGLLTIIYNAEGRKMNTIHQQAQETVNELPSSEQLDDPIPDKSFGWVDRARKKRLKGATAIFKTQSRSESNSQRAYYGPQKNPGPGQYRPDLSKITVRNPIAKFIEYPTTSPKEKVIRVPECIVNNQQCSFQIRRSIKKTGNQSLSINNSNSQLDTLAEKKNKDYQFNELNGKKLVPFEQLLKRSENSIIVNHMIPHDKRFEGIKANYNPHIHRIQLNLLSKFNTLNVPTLKTYSPRPELFPPPELAPPWHDYQIASIQGQKPDLGIPDFKRYTDRPINSNNRPYAQPDGYEITKIEKGYRALSEFKKPKDFPGFERTMARNDAMYNFDREAVRQIKLRLKREEFSFSTYLPNGLKGARDPITESHISLASTAASVLKNVHRMHSRNEEVSGLQSRHSSLSQYTTQNQLLNQNIPKIDMSKMRQINGSFLCEDPKKKLLDLTQYSKAQQRTREYIVGERSTSRTLGYDQSAFK